jgi:hypothetical protein
MLQIAPKSPPPEPLTAAGAEASGGPFDGALSRPAGSASPRPAASAHGGLLFRTMLAHQAAAGAAAQGPCWTPSAGVDFSVSRMEIWMTPIWKYGMISLFLMHLRLP